MLPKLTVISKLFGRSEVTREERSAIKWNFVPRALRSPRACLRSPEKRSQQKTLVRLVIFRVKYHESEKNANWFLFCSMLSLLLYFPPHFWLVLMSLAKTSFVVAQIRVSIKHIFWRQLDYLFITYLSEGFYCFDSSDASDNVMVNFTLVFFKGNKTVDELHQVLEKSVENGSVYSLPVQRGTLRLTLISEFTILCCTECCPINYCKTKT